ncbi:DUF3054 domain-containing protein [Actinomadura spongiicola]|uniref:DUF3054 domain-containing protein n=1 Tax=Actinomadura spongiicola TaxID=2303421 RepID=A0A372GHX6_9ACTN|nr:DUF3054 domain-containing protein [Actinomadura spongiicola]
MRSSLGLGLDVVCVLVFVGIGRGAHHDGVDVVGYLSALWPFLVGVGGGWIAWRVWGRAELIFPSGVGVWGTTVAVGMGLRVLSGQGTAGAFVVVATLFLGAALLGWRVVGRWALLRRR